jgi:hypothetical protein
MKRDYILTPLIVAALFGGCYVASYFLLVSPDFWGSTGRNWIAFANYRSVPHGLVGVANKLYTPIHQLDRKFIRPTKWAGTMPLPLAAMNPVASSPLSSGFNDSTNQMSVETMGH